ARIACYAARLPRFNEAARTKYRTIERDPRNKDTFLKNRAKFLWHYPGADGIKTGYTVPAGRCFVGSATRDGWRLISVVLNSPDMFGETQRLMDYGYASYEPRVLLRAGGYSTQVAVRGGVRADVRAVTAGPIRLVVPRGSSQASRMRVRRTAVSAPVALGAVIGEVVIETVGALTGSTPIVAAQSVPKATIPIRRGPIWPRLLATALSLAVFWYGSANSKAPRGLRRSFAARMRDHHRGGPRHR
ncbi:MAG: D-alanyl-D-alanine carboxypeptidase, partial [Armatimonadetes bacterium]|nr:D-alanyl-D-alanine carboxypeptidase [Armatimonadota bacterium]